MSFADETPVEPRQQCPGRKVGLDHTPVILPYGSKCKDCDIRLVPPPCDACASTDHTTPAHKEPEVFPVLNVAERLQALGLVKQDGAPYDPQPYPPTEEARPFSIEEPKCITGEGPTGPKYGLGRGDLTPRFERRLVAYVAYRAWLAANGGGELS